MVVFSIYHNYSQLYEDVTSNRKRIVKHAFIYLLVQNVACGEMSDAYVNSRLCFVLHIYERHLLDDSFSFPSASDDILQNILVKYMLTGTSVSLR